MAEKTLDTTVETTGISRIDRLRYTLLSSKQTLILGLSSSLTAGAAYSYIVSLDIRYFIPALGIFAGLIGGVGIATRDILSEKEDFKDIPLKDLAVYIAFGILGLFLGYIFVYYFVKLPLPPSPHGESVVTPGTIFDFFKNAMGVPDILGALFGSICSVAFPILFKEKIKVLINKLKINPSY